MAANIVIIGSLGQLGMDLMLEGDRRGEDLVGLNPPQIDIADPISVESTLNPLSPKVVINTAAAHGAKQDMAEEQRHFFNVNALGAWNLARWCWRQDALLVHFSTDYVFGAEESRQQPYTENDIPCPVNLYGASKAAGESLVNAFCPRHYILRVASLYGHKGCRAKNNSNFVKTMLGKVQRGEPLKVVSDQFVSPTWTKAVAVKTYELLEVQPSPDIYHMAGSGACSWFDFASEIVKLVQGSILVEPTTTPTPEPRQLFLRPRYTALVNQNLRRAGLSDLPHWSESLNHCLNEMQNLGSV